MKSTVVGVSPVISRHSLRGLCGLKFHGLSNAVRPTESQSARTVWIEILHNTSNPGGRPRHSLRGLCGLKCQIHRCSHNIVMSQSARTVWIEIPLCRRLWKRRKRSQSARTVWIEISPHLSLRTSISVTVCEDCVD